MADPRISVLMAVRDNVAYIDAAIESVLRQSESGFEFIIIDDASRDGTWERVQAFAEVDPRIRVQRQVEPRGLTRCLIEGGGLVRGEFIARMDGDDISLPERFERQLAYMKANPDCVVVGVQALRVDPEGWPVNILGVPLKHEAIDGTHVNGTGGQVVHPSALIRRSAYERVGGYRSEFVISQDLDLWLRLAEIGKLANLSEVLLMYRLHFKSVSSSNRAAQREAVRRAVREARQRRGLPELNAPIDRGGEEKRCGPAHERRKWTRWALQGGYYTTARKHVLPLLRDEPLKPLHWFQFVRALIGGMLKSDPSMPMLVHGQPYLGTSDQ